MEDKDRVTVIIPTYNRAGSIRRAVDGVLAQTHRDIEVIVVDDCSTDRTLEILDGIADPRLRIVRHQTNCGAGAARHTGVLAAKTDLIAFQDSDDAWLPDKLEVQVRELAALGPDYVAVFGPEIIYGRDGEGSAKRYGPRRVACVPGPDLAIRSGDLSAAFLEGNFLTLQTLLLRREAYFRAGGFDLSLPNNEDWDFNIRLSRTGPIGYIDTPHVIVSNSADGISKNEAANLRSMVMIFGKIRRLAPETPSLPRLALDISRSLMVFERPKASRRYLALALGRRPFDPKLLARMALSRFPGLYRALIARQRARMGMPPTRR